MWTNVAKPLAVMSVMLTACSVPGGAVMAPSQPIVNDMSTGPVASSNEATVFEVSDSAESGWFSAYLKNDDGLSTGELFQRFRAYGQAFCGAKQLVVADGDVVILTADQRRPDPFFQTDFRCEAARS